MSVCTASFLLVGCGIARGRQVTTHHNFINALRDRGGAEVVEGVRFVRDRNVVSAAGVKSGIEMSLWLVGELYGGEVSEQTQELYRLRLAVADDIRRHHQVAGTASGPNLLMDMFGCPRGIIGWLGGVIMERVNAGCGVWVAGLLKVMPDAFTDSRATG
jgi:hypothetical protein